MIGFVNIRNQDDTILEAKWDILVECTIKMKCIDNGQRGFVTRHQRPVPYLMNPFLGWKDSEIGGNQLHPNSNMKNTVYNKRAMTRRLNVTVLKTMIEDPKYKEHLKKTDSGKELLKALKKDVDEAEKAYKAWASKFKKHKHIHHQEMQNLYAELSKALN